MRTLARIGAVAIIAAACAFPAVARGGIVTTHRIDETFLGTSIDYSHVWAWWGTNQPGLVDFAQGDGVMRVDVTPGAQPDFNVSGQTRCAAHGDFDARVHFDLATWPAQNGVWLSMLVGGTGYNVYRVSWQFPESEAYGTFLPPVGTSLPATGTSGTLRLTRRGDIFTGYYLAGRSWIPIISGTGPTGDQPLALGVFNLSAITTFPGQPIAVAFDNFHVLADRIVCP